MERFEKGALEIVIVTVTFDDTYCSAPNSTDNCCNTHCQAAGDPVNGQRRRYKLGKGPQTCVGGSRMIFIIYGTIFSRAHKVGWICPLKRNSLLFRSRESPSDLHGPCPALLLPVFYIV